MLVLKYFLLILSMTVVLMPGNVVSAENRCYNVADMEDNECGSIEIPIGLCASCNVITGNNISRSECPYHFRFNSWIHYELPDLIIISVNSCSLLNNVTCGQLNREGLLCSKCMAGHGLALLSTNWMCAECNDKNSYLMWILYFVLVLVPLTIFFFIVVIFNVRVTSPPFTAYVFYCQYFTELFKTSAYFSTSVVNYINPYVYKLVFTVIDIWSLDFFRHLIPPFCVNSSLTISHYILLDLIPIAYLLFLVVLTYVLIELHARNTHTIVLLWKPFNKCVSKLRRSFDPKASIFNAFSTFILLSLSKVLFLTSLFLYRSQSSYYYDPTKPSLIHTHYFLPVITLLIAFTFLPSLLLLLYPIKCFRRFLYFVCCRRLHCIQAFADTFQGHYKDGTDGTRDYRSMASLQFILRVVLNLGNKWFRAGLTIVHEMKYGIVMFIALSVCYFTIQPYKESYMNTIEGILYSIVAALSVLINAGMIYPNGYIHRYIGYYIIMFLILLPSIILLFMFFRKLIMKIFLYDYIKRGSSKLKECLYDDKPSASQSIEESLPHRMISPSEYSPLL